MNLLETIVLGTLAVLMFVGWACTCIRNWRAKILYPPV
jgi:hypothetical protein